MKRGEIRWVDLPAGSGREQAGRRPAVILLDEAYGESLPVALVVPLTSAVGATRFAGTLLIHPTPENGLTQPSVALAFQLRSVDRNRIGETLGDLLPETLDEILDLLDHLTGRGS